MSGPPVVPQSAQGSHSISTLPNKMWRRKPLQNRAGAPMISKPTLIDTTMDQSTLRGMADVGSVPNQGITPDPEHPIKGKKMKSRLARPRSPSFRIVDDKDPILLSAGSEFGNTSLHASTIPDHTDQHRRTQDHTNLLISDDTVSPLSSSPSTTNSWHDSADVSPIEGESESRSFPKQSKIPIPSRNAGNTNIMAGPGKSSIASTASRPTRPIASNESDTRYGYQVSITGGEPTKKNRYGGRAGTLGATTLKSSTEDKIPRGRGLFELYSDKLNKSRESFLETLPARMRSKSPMTREPTYEPDIVKPIVPLKAGRNSPRSLDRSLDTKGNLGSRMPSHFSPLGDSLETLERTDLSDHRSSFSMHRKPVSGLTGNTSMDHDSRVNYSSLTDDNFSKKDNYVSESSFGQSSSLSNDTFSTGTTNALSTPGGGVHGRRATSTLFTNVAAPKNQNARHPWTPSRRSISTLGEASPANISKGLPEPPPEPEQGDLVSRLEARLEKLRVRRNNTLKIIRELEQGMSPGRGSINATSKQHLRARIEELRTEVADITKEEHEAGLRLHRAWKKREKNTESSALWVRRVTG